jgi:hypothetical protein
MNARIHLITGRTGIGKTARSVLLAEATGAPVVVLDRIQCYPELAVGSGRPQEAELRGTRRIYLTHRRVTEGDLDPAAAHSLLTAWVERLALEADTIILEGGSMSLLQAMMESSFWASYRRSHEHLRPADEASYAARIEVRVAGMLHARPGEPSMLSELTALGAVPEAWAFVQTVIGYGAIFGWCRENGLALADLRRPLESKQTAHLTRRITEAHLAYAEKQDEVFERMRTRWECFDPAHGHSNGEEISCRE